VFKRAAVLGCLTTLIPIVVVIIGLLFAADVGARRYATSQLADRISSSVPEASGVHARIKSFPFVGRILTHGDISVVGAHVDRYQGKGLVFSDIDVELRGATLDKKALINDRQARLTHIDNGTVSVGVTQEALSTALGRTVTVTPGAVTVAFTGSSPVRAQVGLFGPNLVVRAGFLQPITVPLPTGKLLPCLPALTMGQGRIDMHCSFTQIPDAFRTSTGRLPGQ
jgi:hypothetical protein